MTRKLLYQEIMNYLKQKIDNQEFQPEDLIPSEFELARDFNVSRITAQKALDELENLGLIYRIRGKGSFVCDRDPSIRVNQNEKQLKIIALIIPFGSSFGRSFDIIQGLSPVLSKNGYYLTVHISHYSIEEEREIISKLVRDGATGIIVYPFSHRDNIDLINRLMLDNFPLITIDKFYDVLPVSGIYSDNFNGSYQATSHLIELGHENLVFLSDRELIAANSVSERYFGFCKALKDHSLPITDDNLVMVQYYNNDALFEAIKNNYPFSEEHLEPFKNTVSSLLARKNQCTAIHGLNDYLTTYLLKAALSMGIKVPDDLSLVGFDNIDNGAYLEVPLTTVEQDFRKIGEEAGNLIIERINNPLGECKRVILPVELIIRNSTAAIPKAINF